MFVRVSDQRRDPGTSFEATGFPNLGVQDRRLSSTTVTGSWNAILGGAVFNELRAGHNRDRGNRKSQYDASTVATQLGLQVPDTAAGLRGFPAFAFQGTNAIRSITDPSQNANRDTRQEQTTISDTLTLVKGRHSLKFGGFYTRNHAVDGFSLGVTGAAGAYTFGGASTGNSFGDFLLGLPLRSDVGINTRGTLPLDAAANEFGFFAQDDWKVNEALTIFAGVRYEYLGNFVEKHNLLINFDPTTGSLVLPDASIAQYLSPQATATVPQETAAEAGVGPGQRDPLRRSERVERGARRTPPPPSPAGRPAPRPLVGLGELPGRLEGGGRAGRRTSSTNACPVAASPSRRRSSPVGMPSSSGTSSSLLCSAPWSREVTGTFSPHSSSSSARGRHPLVRVDPQLLAGRGDASGRGRDRARRRAG